MKNSEKYLVKMGGGLLLYLLGLEALNLFCKPGSNYRYLLYRMSALMLVYWVTMFIRFVQSRDELMRKVMMEGMAFAGIATAFTCFGIVFTQELSGLKLAVGAAFYIYWFYFPLGLAFAGRRYQ